MKSRAGTGRCHMTPSLGAAFTSSALTQSGRCSLKRPLSFLVGTPYTSKGETNLCSDLGGLDEVTRGRCLLTPPSHSNAARLRGDGPTWVTQARSCFWTRSVFDLQMDLRANQRRAGATAGRGISSGVLLERWRRRACKFGQARRSFDR